jgi:hypothetical protein
MHLLLGSKVEGTVGSNNHEEADTLIYHTVVASTEHPQNSELCVFSTDTDVLVLLMAKYHKLLPNTSITLASGRQHIRPLVNAIGEEKATSLLGFHAWEDHSLKPLP